MTADVSLLAALLAGVVSFLSPCVLPLVPPFLDRIYYRGPASGHFDGARFFNPDRDAPRPMRPGNVFSRHDTHFRLSYAAADATIDRGIEILNHLAKK